MSTGTKNNSRNNGHDARSTAAGTPAAGGAGAKAPAPAPARIQASWYETQVAKTIMAAAKEARDNEAIVVVHGPSGSGKTTVARMVTGGSRNIEYYRVDEAHTSFREFTGALHNLMVYPIVHVGPSRLGKTSAGSQLRLLIVDEAERLDRRCLNWLRDQYDAGQDDINGAGFGLLLLCTRELVNWIDREAAHDRGQLKSRIASFYDLDSIESGGGRRFTLEDIRGLFGHVGLDRTAERFLRDVANRPDEGAIRRCGWLLTKAKALAGGDGGSSRLTAEHLELAETAIKGHRRTRPAQRRAAAV